jgi:hypothetical protein
MGLVELLPTEGLLQLEQKSGGASLIPGGHFPSFRLNCKQIRVRTPSLPSRTYSGTSADVRFLVSAGSWDGDGGTGSEMIRIIIKKSYFRCFRLFLFMQSSLPLLRLRPCEWDQKRAFVFTHVRRNWLPRLLHIPALENQPREMEISTYWTEKY